MRRVRWSALDIHHRDPAVVRILTILLVLAAVSVAQGQPTVQRTVWTGAYSDAQAARGARVYEANCARCHLANLKGNEMAPALADDSFLSSWDGKSVRSLYRLIVSTMPADNPGALDAGDVLDIVAYLLQANRFPAGSADLNASDEAQHIQIIRHRPSGQ
jgi:cytochrome c